MTSKQTVYVDKKTESYPLWVAEMKYDKSKSLRNNYIDNALRPYSRSNTYYTLGQQERRIALEDAMKEQSANKKVKKKSWRDYVKFIL